MMVGEQLQGVIRVRYSLAFLERQLAEYAKERDSTTRRLALRGLLIGGVSLLFGALLSVLVAISITRPIKGLASTASQLARGNLSARTDLATRDELGALGGVLNHMADRLILLVSETAQRARLSKEMEVAAAVQESLVPGPAAISLGLVTLAGFYRPAEVCGGDWWNIFYVDDRRVMIVIGDVTGHGVSSAMLTASAKSACDAMARERGPKLTVLGLMQTLNHVIYQVGRRQLLMTCNITMLDRATGHVEFGSAGHPLPYIVSMQDGQPHLRGLIARGNRLGDRTDWNFKIETDQLQPDDMILWYTDGLTECENPRGEEFGEKRLRNLLVQQMRHNASSARDKLASAADDFYRGKAQADDITFVVGKVERT
ncbi:MAG: SpoIIE family protein phosphatase [Myxococcales bacterium]|nr:SpoIIE family protein phosphatase [Myxococcales bacterium]